MDEDLLKFCPPAETKTSKVSSALLLEKANDCLDNFLKIDNQYLLEVLENQHSFDDDLAHIEALRRQITKLGAEFEVPDWDIRFTKFQHRLELLKQFTKKYTDLRSIADFDFIYYSQILTILGLKYLISEDIPGNTQFIEDFVQEHAPEHLLINKKHNKPTNAFCFDPIFPALYVINENISESLLKRKKFLIDIETANFELRKKISAVFSGNTMEHIDTFGPHTIWILSGNQPQAYDCTEPFVKNFETNKHNFRFKARPTSAVLYCSTTKVDMLYGLLAEYFLCSLGNEILRNGSLFYINFLEYSFGSYTESIANLVKTSESFHDRIRPLVYFNSCKISMKKVLELVIHEQH